MLTNEIWEKINKISIEISGLSAKETDRKKILQLIYKVVPFNFGIFLLTVRKHNGEIQFINRVIESKLSEQEIKQLSKALEDAEALDYGRWIAYEKTPVYIDERAALDPQARCNSTFYNMVIKKYKLYENFSFSIVANEMCLGIITLSRKSNLCFSEDEVQILKALGPHISSVLLKSYLENSKLFSVERYSHFVRKYHLTDREMDLLECIKDGKENKEIAKDLCVSENTVKKHINNILSKTGVANKYQLMKVLIDEKMINNDL